MECQRQVGCHACVNFLQVLEARLEAQDKAEALAFDERKKTMELLKAFKKGG